ncbi:hypothetical protein CGLO_05715 [Colletotrichum gloeosporioides Cg-14]|uniref:Uncharacterized protein n=1 Tax=Colletotrichum gloeosporioides (strain Cg-14) TaxID=1237896 RepID=T0KQW9_COLGC|nr:hypothetical protein CGLO_05715 [Colletotrichum gloeosporioides Cg-14]
MQRARATTASYLCMGRLRWTQVRRLDDDDDDNNNNNNNNNNKLT